MNTINSRQFLLIFWVASWTIHVPAQSVLNPGISVIPRCRIESDDGAELPARREFSRPVFTLEEFELKEVYATLLRRLPLDLNVRVGKYLAEYGRLNTSHPHAWPFLSKPVSLERFLGEEGLNDLGISVSYVIPTGDLFYIRLTADILSGRASRAWILCQAASSVALDSLTR
ncbi:MAG: hypothetical protein FJ217_05525 [Ignavibacteria bacterium]|nr:hypothetical protein [Ignavibacteria bacterium]